MNGWKHIGEFLALRRNTSLLLMALVLAALLSWVKLASAEYSCAPMSAVPPLRPLRES